MTPEKALSKGYTLFWAFTGKTVHIERFADDCPNVDKIGEEAATHRADTREDAPLYRDICRHCDPEKSIDRSNRTQTEILEAAGFEVEHGSVNGSVVDANRQVVSAREVADGD